jgi:uncharacterized protein (TIGR03083 family)
VTKNIEQKEIVEGLAEERERLASWLGALPHESWNAASMCEGWRVRDVVSHLVGNCADVQAQNMDGIGSPAYAARQIAERADRTPAQLLEEWETVGPGVEAIYAAMPPELWALDIGGVIGRVGDGVLRHLEDLWVHAQDVRIPLGADPTAGPGMTAALELICVELPKELTGAGVGALELSFPDFQKTISIGDDGPAVHVGGDPLAFVLVATGRQALSAAVAEGRLVVEPDVPGLEQRLNIYGANFEARAAGTGG